MKRTKLIYRFHNPNSAEDTADFLRKLMIEVNTGKLERAIGEAALYTENGEYIPEIQEKYVFDGKTRRKNLAFCVSNTRE